ncbi:MAG: hypothetical protein U0L11_07510 [Acutalibacteraceae bacterium]|nr:hypothetical protein [Acutalibacteraceae bacterium]
MNSKKRNIIIAVVAAVIAVAIAVVTIVFITADDNKTDIIPGEVSSSTTKAKPTVKYDPEDYEDYICANCESKIKGKSYFPSDEFMLYVTQDFEKEDLAICEDCAKEIYKDELASGKSLDEFLKK